MCPSRVATAGVVWPSFHPSYHLMLRLDPNESELGAITVTLDVRGMHQLRYAVKISIADCLTGAVPMTARGVFSVSYIYIYINRGLVTGTG